MLCSVNKTFCYLSYAKKKGFATCKMWHLFLTEFLPPASHILPLQFSPIAEVEEEEEEIEGKKLELSQTKRVSPRYTEWSGAGITTPIVPFIARITHVQHVSQTTFLTPTRKMGFVNCLFHSCSLVSCPDYFSEAERKNSLVNCLFNFCSNRHVRGAPIRLLHVNDVTYCSIWRSKMARQLKRYAGD